MVLKDFGEGFPDQAEMSAVDLVLYFSEEAEDTGQQLQEVLINALPEIWLELFRGFDELVTGLRRPEVEPALVVLVVVHRLELEQFLPLRPVLENSKVFLVLPEDSGEIKDLAQRLSPFYMCSASDDFVELASIIDEILKERRIS
ncbi:MAG: hypothetical protein ACLFUU_09165 [Desulfobacteraceae bacterium]